MEEDPFDFENREKPRFFRGIYLKWKFKWRHFPRDIKYGIRNIISWFTTIWRDRPWDHSYFYIVMKKKLVEMSLYHVDMIDFYEGAENNIKWINTCINLIDRIQDGYYDMEHMDYIKKKRSFSPVEKTEEGDYFTMRSEIIEETLDDYFAKHPREYKQAIEILTTKATSNRTLDLNDPEDKELIAIFASGLVEQKAVELLFKILTNNLSKWWV